MFYSTFDLQLSTSCIIRGLAPVIAVLLALSAATAESPSPTVTRTLVPTRTRTHTSTQTPTLTPTRTFTRRPSQTPTPTRTPVRSHTPTATATSTRTFTPSSTRTASRTHTATPTSTATRTPTSTRTPTATVSATRTATSTRTPRPTSTPTASFSPTGTHTPLPSPSATHTPPDTFTSTPTPTATRTPEARFELVEITVPLHAGPVAIAGFTAPDPGSTERLQLGVAAADEPRLLLLSGAEAVDLEIEADVIVEGASGGFADLVAVDLDGNGTTDFVGSLPQSNWIVAFLVNRLGSVGISVTTVEPVPGRLLARDLDGDGIPDLAVATADSIAVLRGGGDGSFLPVIRLMVGAPVTDIVLGDFTDDGKLDLLAAVPDQDAIRVHRGFGDGTFLRSGGLRGERPAALEVGRFIGDERLDLIAGNLGGPSVAAFRGLPSALSTSPVLTRDVVANRLIAADVNRDGLADLIGLDAAAGRVLALIGESPFRKVLAADLGQVAGGIAVADLDRDDLPDLLLSVPELDAIVIAFNQTLPAPTVTPTVTSTPTVTRTPTDTATPTETAIPTESPIPSETPSATPTATETPTTVPTATPSTTDTPTPTEVPTDTALPTETRTPTVRPSCPGDCSGDEEVTVNELLTGVNAALGTLAPDACPAFDLDRNGQITIDELLRAVAAALSGCEVS